MKSRKKLYQQDLKPPGTFLDVVACFSEDEWKLLHEWQNELFNNVMKEIHQALTSLGPVIASSVFSLRAKENEHQILSYGFPALDAGVILRMEQDVEVGLAGDGTSKEERIIIPHSASPVDRTDALHKIKSDDNQETERMQNNNFPSTGPGTFTPVTSFRIIQQGEKSAISHQHSGTQDISIQSGVNTSRNTIKSQQESHLEGASISNECENNIVHKVDAIQHHSINPDNSMTPHTHYDNGFPLWSPRVKRKRNHKGKKMQFVVAEPKQSINELTPIGSYQNMQTESELYICRKCGNCFQQSLKGTVHHQSNMEMELNTCDDCEKSFCQLTNLNNDQGEQMGEKPHKCTECGKSFRIAQSLLIHRRVHTGEKPYTCNQCGKDFRQLPHLVMHKRSHTGEKPYVCIVCERGFINSSNLKRHQQIHTRELGIP